MEHEDQLAALRAEIDQARAHIVEMAATISAYFAALVEDGTFTRDEAFDLAREFQAIVFGNSVDDD